MTELTRSKELDVLFYVHVKGVEADLVDVLPLKVRWQLPMLPRVGEGYVDSMLGFEFNDIDLVVYKIVWFPSMVYIILVPLKEYEEKVAPTFTLRNIGRRY